MQQDFLTILMFLVFGGAFVLLNMVAIGRLLRSKSDMTKAGDESYECGEPTFGGAFIRFDIRFYVICLVFVIFDVEVLFLFPWAATLKTLGPLAYVEGVVFVGILLAGLAYVWRKGDIDWTPSHSRQAPGARLTDDQPALGGPVQVPQAAPAAPGAATGAQHVEAGA